METAAFDSTQAFQATDEMSESMRVRDLLRKGQQMLVRSGVSNGLQEASWIVQAGLGVKPLGLYVDGARIVKDDERERVLSLLHRRTKLEPLQYILGTQEFCGLEFVVTPSVLIPRPETESLVGEILRVARHRPVPVVADIGTGSGCVAVALAKELRNTTVYAIDISAAALEVAGANAKRHDVAQRIHFLKGDLLIPLQELGLERRITVMISNPPYIPDHEISGLQAEVSQYEPPLALAGGPDGLAFHRRLLREAPPFLESGGLLVVEVGEGQAETVAHMAAGLDAYRDIQILKDQIGLPRAVRLERRASHS